ncbi:MAG: Ni/Fe-hydrogenase cytochrome b subunit [Candidatus Hydrogenedentes bacterium]|nr:Ni/Fe-hydrogenase cytochrome b subunit [Candidatus Hydrogenedentota bacterium]
MTLRGYLRSLVTPGNAVVAAILCVGFPITILRFTQGLERVSNLSNDYPWGLWVGFDVLCGVALAAGGFCLAATVHIFHMHQYEAIVRPAILTGFLGYFFVAVGLLLDLGRPWRLPYPLFVSHGTTSVMFEVAWCVAMYLTVLFLEFSPALFVWLGWEKLRRWVARLTFMLAILGVVLSTLHQSALGGLFLVAANKLHPLWYSIYIPAFFLVSAMAAGVSMVIFEGWLSHRIFASRLGTGPHHNFDQLTLGLAKASAIILFTYFCLKWIGVAHDNRWAYLWSGFGALFLVELLGFVLAPAILYTVAVKRRSVTLARIAAVWAVLGVVLNRLNVSLFAYNWQFPERYVPHWMEIAISITLVTIGLMTFRFIVNRMPILNAEAEDKAHAIHPFRRAA